MQVITPELVNTKYDRLVSEIGEICARKGRKNNVKIVAVTKYLFPSQMELLAGTKIREIGESRVRDAAGKRDLLAHLHLTDAGDQAAGGAPPGFAWHMVGHLQTNKAREAALIFDTIHSIDRAELALKLQAALEECGRMITGLIEVNIFNEPQKQGATAESVKELADFVKAKCMNIELTGLMCMAPRDADEGALRKGFTSLTEIAAKLGLPELSMGMTDDYRIAVECGSTIVRAGRYFWE